MAAVMGGTAPLSADETRRQLRRAAIASTVGTTIEWYDLFLYGVVTGLVFAKLYFPESDPAVGTLLAFLIYAVGFAARPLGAAIFGRYAGRLGRKATLIVTLLLMGLASVAVALVPSYAEIGAWGAILLTVLRFIEGIGAGGEWGGSAQFPSGAAGAAEQWGSVASCRQFGVPAGLFLANMAVLATSQISGGEFLDWSWRVPFLLGIVLVAIGLYIRLGMLKTPARDRRGRRYA